uniref:AlNc14C9G1212 protein n=1 Tax=Albugo laibachii Nc14 TaxID=890382 RepID=F0W2G1_9STRA|nr:AlNc14C9G1212 [Albugo laibachii Nc14]|eukprot:CCA15247.1 AlNc14C9G1212 [Albugo laibachii Nc14]
MYSSMPSVVSVQSCIGQILRSLVIRKFTSKHSDVPNTRHSAQMYRTCATALSLICSKALSSQRQLHAIDHGQECDLDSLTAAVQYGMQYCSERNDNVCKKLSEEFRKAIKHLAPLGSSEHRGRSLRPISSSTSDSASDVSTCAEERDSEKPISKKCQNIKKMFWSAVEAAKKSLSSPSTLLKNCPSVFLVSATAIPVLLNQLAFEEEYQPGKFPMKTFGLDVARSIAIGIMSGTLAHHEEPIKSGDKNAANVAASFFRNTEPSHSAAPPQHSVEAV